MPHRWRRRPWIGFRGPGIDRMASCQYRLSRLCSLRLLVDCDRLGGPAPDASVVALPVRLAGLTSHDLAVTTHGQRVDELHALRLLVAGHVPAAILDDLLCGRLGTGLEHHQ